MEKSNIIVFIHGLFNNPKCWREWVSYFEKEGYVCHAPAYPFHNGNPQELRKNPDPKLAKTTFNDVYQFLEGYISALPGKPILVGHSVGGLMVQKLLENKKGSMGICICSAPPLGIFTLKWSFLKANWPIINPFKRNKICLPDVEWYHYSICNTMTWTETTIAYDEYLVPESRNILRTVPAIKFNRCRAPLLFIAAEKDRIVPAKLNHRNFKAYNCSTNSKEIKEFQGRTHFICWQNNWQEVADYAQRWLQRTHPEE